MFKKFGYLLLLSTLTSNVFADEILIQINTRDGVTQRALFIEADNATHTVMLFTGGGGWIKLKDDGRIRKAKNNFAVRTRDYFLDAGMNVVIVDSPSDHYSKMGMRGGFRTSADHITDLTALITEIRKLSNKPIWLSGTSRGTESVAYAAIYLKGVAGIILTSSVTETNNWGDPITSLDLDKITVPVFIGAHEGDECSTTPPHGAKQIRSQLKNAKTIAYRIYKGGDEAVSEPCQARSAHGFYGIEGQILSDMIKFIKAK